MESVSTRKSKFTILEEKPDLPSLVILRRVREAQRAMVKLEEQDSRVFVSIAKNGKGIGPRLEELQTGSYGKQRVEEHFCGAYKLYRGDGTHMAHCDTPVRGFIEGFARRSKIDVNLIVAPGFERLSPDLEIAIFRIVQERLTNVHHHSGSRKSELRLARRHGSIHLEVSDEGKGICVSRIVAKEKLLTRRLPQAKRMGPFARSRRVQPVRNDHRPVSLKGFLST
jgi:signal transduction histidine kinase